MGLLESGYLGQQPEGGHRRAGRHRHLMGAPPVTQLTGRLGQAQQGFLHHLVVLAARRGEVHGPGSALEQALAEKVFQMAHLAADRALGDAELLGRQGKAQMPGGSLEGHEAVERRHWLNFHGHANRFVVVFVDAVIASARPSA
ncbi:hypothetical protein D3C85_1387470 [compost metagenome]